jgi:uncharacterized protein YjaG (DUF416 family)
MNIFDEQGLLTQLSKLRAQHRVAFCASICERLLPGFDRFATEEDFGNVQILRQGLDIAWECAQGSNPAGEIVSELSRQAEEVAPDPGEFTSDFASAALDAANAVSATLRCCETGEVDHCLEVATYARDSVDMYIQIRGDVNDADPLLEEKIVAHPLMQREIERQLRALEILEDTREVDDRVIATLRALAGSAFV